jgi:hypothetical protein
MGTGGRKIDRSDASGETRQQRKRNVRITPQRGWPPGRAAAFNGLTLASILLTQCIGATFQQALPTIYFSVLPHEEQDIRDHLTTYT